jgi:hypothetical protein
MRRFFYNPIVVLLYLLSSSVYAETPNQNDSHHHHSLQYGSFYTKEHVRIPPEHGIPFDEQTVLPACGIQHIPGSAEFFLKEPGIYRVIYSVSAKEAGSRVALQLNDSIIQGSEMCIGQANELSTLGLLIEVCGRSCCDHKLRVINNYPLYEVGWYSKDICLSSCCEHGNVSASIVIERVANCCKEHHENCCKDSKDCCKK